MKNLAILVLLFATFSIPHNLSALSIKIDGDIIIYTGEGIVNGGNSSPKDEPPSSPPESEEK